MWRDSFSSSVLVADQDSNKMSVIYDKDPTRSAAHALFYANVGNILAGCFISKPTPKHKTSLLRVELVRIEGLTTKQVQTETLPDAKLKALFLASSPRDLDFTKEPSDSELETILQSFADLPSLPNARQMMKEAIIKAMTPPAKQHLFWGLPRQKEEY